jgi:hypothetical protein
MDTTMRDTFGADAPSESATAAPPAPAPAPAPAAPAAAPPAAPAGPAPTLQQAVDKAVAKSDADKAVAAMPEATHHIKLDPLAPTVLGSAATGAGIGFWLGGPPGALVGAGIGWVAERYQIGGGLFGKAVAKIKGFGGGAPPAAKV